MNHPSFSMGRRAFVASLALGSVGSVSAQGTYPNGPIRIVTPFNSGTVDILGRAFAERLAEQMGAPVVVESLPGAGGIIGSSAVVRAVADGQTLLFTAVEPLVMAPLLLRRPPFDPLVDLTPISKIANSPMILVAHPAAPFQTAAEMVGYAKQHPDKLFYASSGAGTPDHIIMERLQEALGFKATITPYKSTAQKTADTLAGHVPVTLLSLSGAQQYLSAKSLRPLAIGSLTRRPELADVPAMAELTKAPFDGTLGYGFYGPAKLPPQIAARLHNEISKALSSTQIASTLPKLGSEVNLLDAKAFAAEMSRQQKEGRELVQRLNLAQ
ncbi:Bug family tripartite tricarboxylate transporter substrate binding protein [Hydrogenophaga sp. BPS33]|uniref:Bug family tripartite tricarboxylate transporter substrate binding protein n=1 Tax=Hydrogenophaga sp. BPS33 TaxID=2651974 RepID=UPI00132045BB|nr:tripartite tricarboxylate transporter substrate binding protein [Hydrogenophaga sp. BPS33]QHE84150.1 tripartite tricarboxylate transporter substrate binding protein [Hydrogenophaga sp. BPS33]